MYTQCPNCDAIFRLQHAHLRAAGGHVRCSQCQHTFNAAKQRVEDLPNEEELDAVEAELEGRLQKNNGTTGRVLKFILAIGLIFSLVVQYYWYQQPDFFLQNKDLRPWLDSTCAYIPSCELPMTRDINAFKTEKHHLSVHELSQNAVTLHIVFSNQAIFPQAYPRLDIKIEDKNRQLVALRRLMPVEYLPKTVNLAQMAPQEQRHIKLNFANVVPDMHSFGYDISYQ